MAKRKLDIFLGMDNAELKTKLNESSNLLNNFKTTIGGVLGGAALGLSIKSVGDFAINASKSFEQAQISFSRMLQSEKQGQKLINDIQDLANKTPMTSESLNNNARLLLNFNAVADNEVIPTLKMLGDITGGDEQRMNSLTLAFAQSASAGRLMGQDLLQMINAGFNPLQVMSEKTGKSIAQLKDDMSKGKIGTDMVIQAFKDATEAGGKFYGMMEAQSKSKAGLEATKADSLEILARTITDSAMPALKEFDQAQIDIINNMTTAVKKIQEWASVNHQTTNAITNGALALTTVVLGYKSLEAVIKTVSTVHMQAVSAIKAMEAAELEAAYAAKVAQAAEVALYQARLSGNAAAIKECLAVRASTAEKAAETAATAKATQATVLHYAATGNFTKALQLAIVQVRAFTVSLLANPLTWVAVALAGVTAAVFAYKNELEATSKALDDINAKHEQLIQTTDEEIQTVNRLVGVKKRSVAQEEELNKAIDNLVQKYPEIFKNYDTEILKLQGINNELAKRIYLMGVAETKEKLLKEKAKTDKKVEDQHRAYIMNNQISAARYGTPIDTDLNNRKGVKKQVQKDQDRINKQLKELEDLEKKILNNEVSLGGKDETSRSSRPTSTASTSESDKNKAARAAEKARKEAIALKEAQIDAELLRVRKNSEEEYQLELKKIDAKIALEKVGTAKYQQALNERTKLMQAHQEELAQIELDAYNNKAKLDEIRIERDKMLLEAENEKGGVSNEEYYKRLQEFEDQKYNIALEGLNRQAELYKNDVRKVEEINYEKLVLEANYQNEKLKLTTEAMKTETQTWRNLFGEVGSAFNDTLSDFLSGNQTLKDSFLGIFDDIKRSFAKMVANMLAEQAKLAVVKSVTAAAGMGGWVGTAANFIKGFFADGGIVPGTYNQAMPIVAHGSEMVLNPLQQKNLWNLIASGQNATAKPTQNTSNGQPVIVNNITPVFQSLDPAQGQKLFNNWMKQSGIPLVRDSIKNNNYQMRDIVRGV